MPINPGDSSSTRNLALFVSFSWGSTPHTAQYVRWDSDVLGFVSAPELDVRPAEMHGGMADTPWQVIIRSDRPPLNTLLRPYAHAPVNVEIAEADPFDFADTKRVWWSGLIQRSSPAEHPTLRLLDVQGHKSRIPNPLGVECLHECVHMFGDPGCEIDLAPLKKTATISAISGNVITVGTGLANGDVSWWRFGEAEYDGLRIKITEALNHPTMFKLLRPPPPEWLTHVATFTPGCDRMLDGDCRNKWHNEERIIPLGFKMPQYHPLFDTGGTTE